MAKTAVLLGTLWVLLLMLLVYVREGEGTTSYSDTWNILYDDETLKFSKGDANVLFSMGDSGVVGKYFDSPVPSYRSLSLNNNYYWQAADTDDAIDNKDELSIMFRVKVWPDNTLGSFWNYPLLVKSGSWEICFCKMISGCL